MVLQHKEIWLEVYWDEAPNGGITITEIKYKGIDVFYIYYYNNLISAIGDIVLEYLEKGNTEGDYFGWIEENPKENQRKAIETINMVKLTESLLFGI